MGGMLVSGSEAMANGQARDLGWKMPGPAVWTGEEGEEDDEGGE